MVKWALPAKRDLKQIHDYIARDSKFYARKVVQTIVDQTMLLPGHPRIGRIVPEIQDQNVRELFIYSYRLIYEIGSEEVEILAVIHGRRNFLEGLTE